MGGQTRQSRGGRRGLSRLPGSRRDAGAAVNAAIITISTSVAAGRTEDVSGQALAELAAEAGAEVVAQEVVSDDRARIEEALRRHSAPDAGISFIFTTGGTGLT